MENKPEPSTESRPSMEDVDRRIFIEGVIACILGAIGVIFGLLSILSDKEEQKAPARKRKPEHGTAGCDRHTAFENQRGAEQEESASVETACAHITPAGGNVFADLGFDPEQAAKLKEESQRMIEKRR